MTTKKNYTLKEVAEKVGMGYQTLRKYVVEYTDKLEEEGVLIKKEGIVRNRYFITASPEKFIKILKKYVRKNYG
jgi:predicted transcriptional regulator